MTLVNSGSRVNARMKNVAINRLGIFVLFGIILVLNIASIRHKTLTYDEGGHFRYGLQMLEGNSDRSEKFSDSKMPFSALNAFPGKIGQWLGPFIHSKGIADFLADIKTGRYVTILFSLLLAFYIYRWAKDLYGPAGGLFSLFLYTFAPNIIAHSRLVTTDLYAACMITIATYYFWKLNKSGSWKAAGVSAVTLGLSQLAKYTSIYLYPIFGLIFTVRSCQRRFRPNIGSFLRFFLFFIVVSVIIINVGFLFNRPLTSLEGYQFKSDLFKTIQSKAGILKKIPLFLPYPFIDGLDWVRFNERTGKSLSGGIYLLGELIKPGKNFRGFKGYYLIAFLFKVPIAVQILIFIAAVRYALNRRRFNFFEDEIFLLVPVLFFFFYFNFFYRFQIGIRHILVLFPFLYIFCGSLLKSRTQPRFGLKGAILFLSVYLVGSVLSYFPHYISYFNELVWDRKQAHRILASSNIDWGQNRWYLGQYLKRYPDAIVRPEKPVAGRIILEVNSLVRYYPKRYEWLRKNFEPVDHVAYSYLVYQVSPADLARITAVSGTESPMREGD